MAGGRSGGGRSGGGDGAGATLKKRSGRNASLPALNDAYGSALLPRNGKLRSVSPAPSASCVSISTATPAWPAVVCHPPDGYTAARYSPPPTWTAFASQFELAPAVPPPLPTLYAGCPPPAIHVPLLLCA